jgi:hypothetical protein
MVAVFLIFVSAERRSEVVVFRLFFAGLSGERNGTKWSRPASLTERSGDLAGSGTKARTWRLCPPEAKRRVSDTTGGTKRRGGQAE